MAQVQKESVRKLILETALTLFATKGYVNTSIADIAKSAGISVGNVYHYFKGKQDVLDEVIPEEYILNLRKQIFQKIDTGKSKTIRQQSENEEYILTSELFLQGMISNRLRFLALMKCGKESHYADFEDELLHYLVKIFMEKFVKEEERESKKGTIELLYGGFIQLCTNVLTMNCDESTMYEELKAITRYHIFGLASLVENK